jgi:integrase
MPIVNLSHDFVSKAVCPEGKKKINFYHQDIRGFLLEVRKSGGKTYALRYRDKHNRQCQYKIGDSKDISYEKARRAAEKARGKVVLGQDPAEDKRVKRKVPTLNYFVQFNYLPFIKKDKRSWKTDASMLKNHILPRFGKQHLDKITSQAVMGFHQSMKANGYSPGMANRGVKLLRYIFNLAMSWEVPGVDTNPASGLKFFAEDIKERFLSAEETSRLMAALENSKNTQLKYIVPLLLLLGCRKNELLQSRWEEFNLQKRIWYLPSSKTGSRHIPIPLAALKILDQLPRWDGCPYVVPNPDTLRPFVQIHKAWDNARMAAGLPDVRMHDLRHSMASNMVNSGRSIYEVAKVLGHSQLKTTQRYAHLSQETLLEAVDAAAEATGTDWG